MEKDDHSTTEEKSALLPFPLNQEKTMTEESSKVSIILPTFNGAKIMGSSIDSCLNQTYGNIELIIVDDGSTDATPEVVGKYADDRIIYIRNEKNMHLPMALNKGFSHSRGEYLTWTSDDNEYLPTAIETMKRYLDENRDADLVYSDFWHYWRKTREKKLITLNDCLDLSSHNALGSCFLYRRRVYESMGNYDPKYELVEDYEYWIRITKKFKTVHCPILLYIHTRHDNSLTSREIDTVGLLLHVLRYRFKFIGRREMSQQMRGNIKLVIKKSIDIKGGFFSINRNLKRITPISLEIGVIYLLNVLAVIVRMGTRFLFMKAGGIFRF